MACRFTQWATFDPRSNGSRLTCAQKLLKGAGVSDATVAGYSSPSEGSEHRSADRGAPPAGAASDRPTRRPKLRDDTHCRGCETLEIT